jgi:peptide chain release factor subunit 3
VALVETTAPVCVERFTDFPQLGRFTLRDEGSVRLSIWAVFPAHRLHNIGKTIAIGKITKLIERGDEDLPDGVAKLSLATA